MDVGGVLTYVAGLSVATERITEFLKRFPGLSNLLSTKKEGAAEDIRVIAVNLLAVLIGMIVCYCFPSTLPNLDQSSGNPPTWIICFGYGLLASGGSSFWNSALDTFRGVKKQMGQ